MIPARLAALHRAAFANTRGWSAEEFATLLERPGAIVVEAPEGFALGQAVIDEAELLALAVAPAARRRGLGRRLLRDFERAARKAGAARAFLEVATDNLPAVALYRAAGWSESGRRPGYYPRTGAPACDAVILAKHLA
ncbi:MAG TPA: GNAT family N-acetyltransferase [Rhodobacteraceae bacterium]|nr:GNAT family N-acetyltransferase [Paracoccaceae bacterium]